MADGLLEAVRGLHLAHPELGPKPLLAKLREQQPDLVRAAPDECTAHRMRALVLSGLTKPCAREAGTRSAAELREAATHFERAAALQPAPALKATLTDGAAWCRRREAAVYHCAQRPLQKTCQRRTGS